MKEFRFRPKYTELPLTMMAEEVAQLVREVERVVTAPYIPSLQVDWIIDAPYQI